MVREITGISEGNGPMITVHDGVNGPANWAGFPRCRSPCLAYIPSRLFSPTPIMIHATYTHSYFAFEGQWNRQPVNISAEGDTSQLGGQWPLQACDSWGKSHNDGRSASGVIIAGEFSNAVNDCGLYVDGVGRSTRYESDSGYWQNVSGWSDGATKQGLVNFALASMDALGDWFFWTWKIGNSTTTNSV